MREKIIQLLSDVERERNVRILYACESGSRAWGFHSEDSDYDIRFIYASPPSCYLSVSDPKDTIEIAIKDDLDPGGWDIRKALGLLGKSNGPLIEWLHSPIVYLDRDGFRERWKKLSREVLQASKLRHHYMGLAVQISRKKLAEDAPSVKSYLYVMRALLAARWIDVHGNSPPVPFAELVAATENPLRNSLNELIAAKASIHETESMGRKEILDRFIEQALEQDKPTEEVCDLSSETITCALNREFRSIILPKSKSLIRKSDLTLKKIRQKDLMLLDVLSGSHAYGTQTPQSDIDLRGVFIAPDSFHASMEMVEQVADDKNDEVYFELTRFFQLLEKNNPGALEILYSPPDCIRYKHPAFDLIDPRLFLSKLCEKSFSGYAEMQIKKARGLNKKMVNPQPEQRKHFREFCYVLEAQGSVSLGSWLERMGMNEKNCGLVAVNHAPSTYALFHDPQQNYRGIFSPKDDAALLCSSVPIEAKPVAWLNCNVDAFKAHCRAHREYWQWVQERNEERYRTNKEHGLEYDTKNIMHTFRLLDMALEIANEGEVRVRRPNATWLLEVKDGKLSYEEILTQTEDRLLDIRNAFEKSSLPEEPDRDRISDLLREVQEEFASSNIV
ncbi:MAG: nucleotidyltransferase domain-containing protein [Verrucomicrobiota bacterium]